MKKVLLTLVFLLAMLPRDILAEKLTVYRYHDSAVGLFSYNKSSQNVYVFELARPGKGKVAFFSGLITNETVIKVIDKSPEPREVLHTELEKICNKRIAAFGKFYKVVNEKGEIRLLRIDHLLIVVLPEKK